jgi:tetratricopeptide (TPR) repeat protein
MPLRQRLTLAVLVLFALAVGTLAARLLAGRGQMPGGPQDLRLSLGQGVSSRNQVSTDLVAFYDKAVRQAPERAENHALLGSALLQYARETGDPQLYRRAEGAFEDALAREPSNLRALLGLGALALARHRFEDAMTWAERGLERYPNTAALYGVAGDANIELGRYDEAIDAFQKMVDIRPDLASYARVSYVRELWGDRDGALAHMQAAVTAGAAGSEARSWALVQLGHLYFDGGQFKDARRSYQAALDNLAGYPSGLAGLARVHAAEGDYSRAIELYTRVTAALPLPEFVIALGDTYAAAGQPDAAEDQYDLAAAMQSLFGANGIDTDAELAQFEADRGRNVGSALERARRAYAKRPSITVADTLAWTLYQAGDYQGAERVMNDALRLGTRSPLFFFHAGMIHYRLGNFERARAYLGQALALNPRFSLRHSDTARGILEAISREGDFRFSARRENGKDRRCEAGCSPARR